MTRVRLAAIAALAALTPVASGLTGCAKPTPVIGAPIPVSPPPSPVDLLAAAKIPVAPGTDWKRTADIDRDGTVRVCGDKAIYVPGAGEAGQQNARAQEWQTPYGTAGVTMYRLTSAGSDLVERHNREETACATYQADGATLTKQPVGSFDLPEAAAGATVFCEKVQLNAKGLALRPDFRCSAALAGGQVYALAFGTGASQQNALYNLWYMLGATGAQLKALPA